MNQVCILRKYHLNPLILGASFDSAWFSLIFAIRWPVQGVARLFSSLPISQFSWTIYFSALFTYDADARKGSPDQCSTVFMCSVDATDHDPSVEPVVFEIG